MRILHINNNMATYAYFPYQSWYYIFTGPPRPTMWNSSALSLAQAIIYTTVHPQNRIGDSIVSMVRQPTPPVHLDVNGCLSARVIGGLERYLGSWTPTFHTGIG